MTNLSVLTSNYQSGLCSQGENVISAHFMHAQNLRTDFKLYDDETFLKQSVVISDTVFFDRIVPLMHSHVLDVAKLRAEAAYSAAKRNHDAYGICDANKVTVSEVITEILLDRWFRKGPSTNVSRLFICNQIKKAISAGETIFIAAPLLPNKVENPLKTKGTQPCMAEINLLCRLAEIVETIRNARKFFKQENSEKNDVIFKIIADGNRFESALNVGKNSVNEYQQQISWWIEKLGYKSIIQLWDYETLLDAHLNAEQKIQRELFYQHSLTLYEETMWPLFDPVNMEQTLNLAIANDPNPDIENEEGRFVPLFKSILYTYQYDFLTLHAEKHGLHTNHLYREITQNAFTAFANLNTQAYTKVFNYFHGHKGNIPSLELIKEYLRQHLLRAAWQATIEYMAIVKMDRDLLHDPLAVILPNHIRMTIHSKPGQIGLKTSANARGDAVQPWHGVAILRPSKNNTVKFDTISRLAAEAINSRPVLLKKSCPGCNGSDPVSCMENTCQPLFYIHPSLDLTSEELIMASLETQLTRHMH